jgi:hypothetical protein
VIKLLGTDVHKGAAKQTARFTAIIAQVPGK